MSHKMGIDGKLYLSTAAFETPDWVTADKLKDLARADADDAAEISTRECVTKLFAQGMTELGIEFQYREDYEDDAFVILQWAKINRTPIDVLVLDGDIAVNGNHGWRFLAAVFNANEDQALSEADWMSYSLKPTAPNGRGSYGSTFHAPMPVVSSSSAVTEYTFTP